MSISIRNIQRGLVRTINDLLGKDSCISRRLFTSPAILARQNGTRPDLPFVVIDRLPMSNYGYNGKISEFYDENGHLNRITNYKASFLIQVVGAEVDDVESKAQEIRDTLFREYGARKLETETGAVILSISSPSFTFNYLNTEYQEMSTLTLELTVSDQFIENDSACAATHEITRINTRGELDRFESDPNPLTTNSNAP